MILPLGHIWKLLETFLIALVGAGGGEAGCSQHLVGEGQWCWHTSTIQRIVSHDKELSAPNVKSAEIEKTWSTSMEVMH